MIETLRCPAQAVRGRRVLIFRPLRKRAERVNRKSKKRFSIKKILDKVQKKWELSTHVA